MCNFRIAFDDPPPHPKRTLEMPATARLFATVPAEQQERLSELAYAKGLSLPRLLAGLVDKALAENPDEKVKRLVAQAQDDRAPAEKYTVRLMGIDAARLEERAQGRGVTASGYVAHLLRAHLRSEPPMPYAEFQRVKRAVSELTRIRVALQLLVTQGGTSEALDASLRDNVLRLLPPLKQIRDKVDALLMANAESWHTPNV
jgi:hypothetical protein